MNSTAPRVIKGKNSAEVYLIIDGRKCHIPTA